MWPARLFPMNPLTPSINIFKTYLLIIVPQ